MNTSVRIVVADSSPLIALARLGLLDLLPKLFDSVFIPQTVLDECTASECYTEGPSIRAAVVNGWIRQVNDPASLPSWNLDAGETSAIAIAQELQAGIIMDDQAGRRVAGHLGLPVIGTAGILMLAKQKKLITAIRPFLITLAGSGYFLSKPLMDTVLQRAGED